MEWDVGQAQMADWHLETIEHLIGEIRAELRSYTSLMLDDALTPPTGDDPVASSKGDSMADSDPSIESPTPILDPEIDLDERWMAVRRQDLPALADHCAVRIVERWAPTASITYEAEVFTVGSRREGASDPDYLEIQDESGLILFAEPDWRDVEVYVRLRQGYRALSILEHVNFPTFVEIAMGRLTTDDVRDIIGMPMMSRAQCEEVLMSVIERACRMSDNNETVE